jgi:hypothetical protein
MVNLRIITHLDGIAWLLFVRKPPIYIDSGITSDRKIIIDLVSTLMYAELFVYPIFLVLVLMVSSAVCQVIKSASYSKCSHHLVAVTWLSS